MRPNRKWVCLHQAMLKHRLKSKQWRGLSGLHVTMLSLCCHCLKPSLTCFAWFMNTNELGNIHYSQHRFRTSIEVSFDCLSANSKSVNLWVQSEYYGYASTTPTGIYINICLGNGTCEVLRAYSATLGASTSQGRAVDAPWLLKKVWDQ